LIAPAAPAAARRLLIVGLACALAGCGGRQPSKSYPITGQVLAVHPERQQITLKHEDIRNFMPGMTMSFPVASPELLTGREPGEIVTGVLEVTDAVGRLTALERTGFSPLPADSNAVAMAGNLLEVGEVAPDAALIDQDDRRRSFAEWRGTLTLLTFIYTRCPLPNFCPLMDRHFAALQREIAADPRLAGKVRLVSVSFDPDYDTPKVLAAHAARLKADPAVWTFLTGDRVTVDRFAARFGVGLVRPVDATEITHNLRTLLLDADGRLVKVYSGSEWTPAGALEDLRAAVKAP
jgi:protein SCO1/2